MGSGFHISIERRKIIKQTKKIGGREYHQYSLTIPVDYGRELEGKGTTDIVFLRNEGFVGVPKGREHLLLSIAPIILEVERKRLLRLLGSVKSRGGIDERRRVNQK